MSCSYGAILRAELGPLFLADHGDASHLKSELRSVLGRIDTSTSGLVKEKVLRYDCYVYVDAAAPCTLIVVILTEGITRDQASQSLLRVQQLVRERDDLHLMHVSDADRPLQHELQPLLKAVMEDLNDASGDGSSSSQGPTRIERLRNEVDTVKQVMATNVERVLARGERLDDLVDRSADLESASQQFSTSAYRVRRATCWRNAKWNIILVTVIAAILLIVAILILYYCGVFGGSS